MPWRALLTFGLLLTLLACRGEPPGRAMDAVALDRLVDSLRPAVERAVGLPFHAPPRSAQASRQEIRDYLLARVEKTFPPERLAGIEAAYRLFGFLPDTLDLRAFLLDLYSEQVAGYYDPETSTLYAARGVDRSQLRLVMAHELVHALQHQYLSLDSLMNMRGDGDRLAAVQAVLEGHATLASIRMLVPGQDVVASDAFWETYREQIATQQRTMPVFSRAPLVLREGLLFPYLAGAEFMRWWAAARGTPMPDHSQLPRSTEQVLHPTRYAARDEPVQLRFRDSAAGTLYEDTLGELETRILLAEWAGATEVSYTAPLGWGGDRYRVVRTPQGPALEWVVVWDSPAQAARFQAVADTAWRARRPGYQASVTSITAAGRPGHRLISAPTAWYEEDGAAAGDAPMVVLLYEVP